MNAAQAAETIFHAAREFAPGERAAYLQGACGGDAALRACVEALLLADAEAGDFLVGRAADRGTQPTPGEQAGDRIDRYELLQQIGEGGFGAVWMAEQQEPVRRMVALKIIKLGMDTRQVTARFEQERQALALMDHPHIAKVLDAGATTTGRPYFVMELVKGAPIVEYCDMYNLTIDERLGLFAQICHAVQHAHGKGIIHRDLKPSNVLVGTQDGRPHAKVIDFGIAKATSHNLTDKTLFTEHQQVIGTLQYMSPEQAEGSLDIDTRTDVYSLGVVLYELLVGEPPFTRAELQSAGLMEVRRILREVEPKKPSTRISDSHDTLASVAAHRRVEPKRLGVLVRGDLDWIVMKALEKDRSRRYETVNGLVMDIQRHLGGEPVTAAPPSAGYRLRKFVRRNRVLVSAGAVVAVVLVLGIVGTSYGMVWALDEKQRADEQATKATASAALAAAAATAEAKARVEAQDNEKRAIEEAARATAAAAAEAKAHARAQTIVDFVTSALNSSNPRNTEGNQEMTIVEAMDNAIRDIASGRFGDDPETEMDLQCTIALILLDNGRAAEAEPLCVQALETAQRLYEADHADVARALNGLALVRGSLGRLAEAEPLFVQALEMTQRLFKADHPDVARDLCNLALVRMQLSREAEAEPLYVQALEMTQRLFKADHPDVARAMNGLAVARNSLGREAEAEPLFEQALQMNQRLNKGDHADVALGLGNLASVRQSLGRLAEAEPVFVQALDMYQRIYQGDHPQVAIGLNNLAHVRKSLGRLVEAEPLCVQALEMSQRLFEGDHADVARCLNNLASLRRDLGRAAEAEPLYVQALEMSQRLFKSDHEVVARGLNNLATLRQDLGRAAEAETLFLQALEMIQRLYEGDHPRVVVGLTNLANVRLSLGRPAEAEPLFVQALEMKQRLIEGDHADVATSLSNLARVRHSLGKSAEARQAFDAAIAMLRRLSPTGSVVLARVLWRSASARLPGDAAAALPELEEAEALAGRLLPAAHPHLTEYQDTLAKCRAALGK